MNTQKLYRIITRLHHDPQFVKLFEVNPGIIFSEEKLSEKEIKCLQNADPKAFLTDKLRQRRTLDLIAKIADVPVALTISSGNERVLFDFFGTEFFHKTVQNGQSLTAGFCRFIVDSVEEKKIPDERLKYLAELFAAISETIFSPKRIIQPEKLTVSVAPNINFEWLPDGSIELITRIRQYLRKSKNIWDWVNDESKKSVDDIALDSDVMRPVLIEYFSGASVNTVNLSYSSAVISELLRAVSSPVANTFESLIEYAKTIGLSSPYNRELVEKLIADRLIILH